MLKHWSFPGGVNLFSGIGRVERSVCLNGVGKKGQDGESEQVIERPL